MEAPPRCHLTTHPPAPLHLRKPAKSAARLFLNCTKNTELTRVHFLRTFSFALTQKVAWLSRPKTVPRLDPAGIQQPATQPSTRFIAAGWHPMKATEWNTYRTRFLVNAKQLSSNLAFTDTLGRQHSGRKGDYVVESSDGGLRI